MAPKNLLWHKDCQSNIAEFDEVEGHPGSHNQGTRFKRLIEDCNNHNSTEESVNRLILCSGKVSALLHLTKRFKKFRFRAAWSSWAFAGVLWTSWRAWKLRPYWYRDLQSRAALPIPIWSCPERAKTISKYGTSFFSIRCSASTPLFHYSCAW